MYRTHELNQFTLFAGFLFMLLIDQMASKSSGGSHQHLPVIDTESQSSPKSSPRKRPSISPSKSHAVTWTTTLGLLVHAAADGVAMGMFYQYILSIVST